MTRPLTPTDGEWRIDAACRIAIANGTAPDGAWDDDHRPRSARQQDAVRICAGCPVSGSCLNDALVGMTTVGLDDTGIRGGMTGVERSKLLTRLGLRVHRDDVKRRPRRTAA